MSFFTQIRRAVFGPKSIRRITSGVRAEIAELQFSAKHNNRVADEHFAKANSARTEAGTATRLADRYSNLIS